MNAKITAGKMAGKTQLIGAEQLQKQLKQMDQALNQKVIEGAMRYAVKPLVDTARAKAPMGETGNLKKAIGTFTSKRSDRKAKETAAIWVGPRIKGGYKGYHAHLVEFGTEERRPKKGRFLVFEYNGVLVFAKKVKAMQPQPFMIPAYEQTKDSIEARMAESIRRRITNRIK